MEKSGYHAETLDPSVNLLWSAENATFYRFQVDGTQDVGGTLTLTLTTAARDDKVRA